MQPVLVITTINPPTRTVERARELRPDWQVVVVGDQKTPDGEWDGHDVDYWSLARQESSDLRVADHLPVGHYARKNLGYLVAMRGGAPTIAETDDDNVPYDEFLGHVAEDLRARQVLDDGWVNVYRAFSEQRVWPRGFPLEEVNRSLRDRPALGDVAAWQAPVQQHLADGDPDVDAVYRLVTEESVVFEQGDDVVLPAGAWCPFNSQNTIWFPRAYPLLYLPSTVSFRMTDIWRSFVAKRCLDAMGAPLAFRRATVFQDRNEHSLIRDFEAEVDGYLRNPEIVSCLSDLDLDGVPLADQRRCYEALVDLGVVDASELPILDAWTADVAESLGVGTR